MELIPAELVADVRALIADKSKLLQAELVETQEKTKAWRMWQSAVQVLIEYLMSTIAGRQQAVAPPAIDQGEIDEVEAARDASATDPEAAAPAAETKEEIKRRRNPERAAEDPS